MNPSEKGDAPVIFFIKFIFGGGGVGGGGVCMCVTEIARKCVCACVCALSLSLSLSTPPPSPQFDGAAPFSSGFGQRTNMRVNRCVY